MSVVASPLSTVGIRNSDFGLLELMWYPSGTWNESGTVADFPCITLTTGAGDTFIAGPCCPNSSCADARVDNRTSDRTSDALITRILNGPRLELCRQRAPKGAMLEKFRHR